MSNAICSLDPEEEYYQRWISITSLWDYSTMREDTRSHIVDLQLGQFHPEFDPVLDTLEDMYRTKFIINRVSSNLGISFKEWTKQPKYMCDRDIDAIIRCDKAKADRLVIPPELDPDQE